MQRQYAGEEVYFEGEEFARLLERCREVGNRIHQAEWPSIQRMGFNGVRTLIESAAQLHPPKRPEDALSFRLNERQPRLLRGYLHLVAASAESSQPGLCLQLMEAMSQAPVTAFHENAYRTEAELPFLFFPDETAVSVGGVHYAAYREIEKRFADGEITAEEWMAEANKRL